MSTNIEGYGYFPEGDFSKKEDQVIIIELTNKELLLMGHLIHHYLAEKPQSKIASQLLASLSTQSDTVHTDASYHNVYTADNPAPIPIGAIYSGVAWVTPVERNV